MITSFPILNIFELFVSQARRNCSEGRERSFPPSSIRDCSNLYHRQPETGVRGKRQDNDYLIPPTSIFLNYLYHRQGETVVRVEKDHSPILNKGLFKLVSQATRNWSEGKRQDHSIFFFYHSMIREVSPGIM
jgi:hypothetical protein